jgi:hypothetical protein
MAPKAQKEPSWIEEPTKGLGANEYTNNLFTWGRLEFQKK